MGEGTEARRHGGTEGSESCAGERARVLLATGNAHKLEEVRAIFAAMGLEVVGLGELASPLPPEPKEDGATFAANARIKAIAYARATGRKCLADDSGLEVDALGGAPSVHSAYYAGTEGPRAERDARNNAKLIAALRGVPAGKRAARFRCVMSLADPDGRLLHETSGAFEGLIIDTARGVQGFGYDPLFWVPSHACTSAELSPELKNTLSHRGAAARAMAEWLRCQRAP